MDSANGNGKRVPLADVTPSKDQPTWDDSDDDMAPPPVGRRAPGKKPKRATQEEIDDLRAKARAASEAAAAEAKANPPMKLADAIGAGLAVNVGALNGVAPGPIATDAGAAGTGDVEPNPSPRSEPEGPQIQITVAEKELAYGETTKVKALFEFTEKYIDDALDRAKTGPTHCVVLVDTSPSMEGESRTST